ncbi:hypothetical protein LX36DRAFT_552138, partial [Colletotrichum falcatum]
EHHTRSWVVKNVLVRSLDAANRYELITEDDPCFAPARAFRDRWKIEPEPWKSFVRLLRGCRRFPLILLRNPSDHHSKSYEEMVQCDTMKHLSLLLGKYSTSLERVPILDVCSLFSYKDLMAMSYKQRWEAVEAAYELTEKILAILKPEVIICCQCATRGVRSDDGREVWKRAKNPLALQLCSSVSDAKDELAIPIDIRGHRAWAIRGFHPRYCLLNPSEKPVLERLFRDVFEPCETWRNRLAVATL